MKNLSFPGYSQDLQEFVYFLLKRMPDERPTIKQVLKHELIVEAISNFTRDQAKMHNEYERRILELE